MKLYVCKIFLPSSEGEAEFRRTALALASAHLGYFNSIAYSFDDVLVADSDLSALSRVCATFGSRLFTEEIAEVASAGSSRRGCHRLGSWNTCPQEFAFSHLLKLRGVREPPGRAAGSLLHIGLMHHYLNELGRGKYTDPVEAMRAAPARLSYQFEVAREAFFGYLNHYTNESLKILDVEREYVIRVDGHWHTQRLDLVIEQQRQAVIVDHKGSSGRVEAQAKTWETSLQFLSASMVGRALFPKLYGMPFGGVTINVVGLKDNGFARHRLNMSEEAIGRVASTISRTNDEIQREYAAGTDVWDFKRTWACQSVYGSCEFLPLCTRGKAALGQYVSAEDEGTEVQR